MSGRRLTISSLLCADDQAADQAQPEATYPHSLHTPIILSGPGVPPVESRAPQARDPSIPESHRVSYRSRAYSDYDRGNHESIPLSLQPMHLPRHTPSPSTDDPLAYPNLRREHRGDILGRSEMVASNSRPVSREHEISSYASHHLPPATSRQGPSSRRSSDPSRQEYRLYEGSSYFSPPASSRSSQADYLTTPSTFPLQPPPLPHTHSYSPQQHSSPQHVSPTLRRPLQSPALGLHYITDSPPITLGRMSRPHSNSPGLAYPSQSPRHPHSPPGPPLTGSPSQESLTGLSTHHRSASFSQQEVPFVTPRPSSVTALLNTEPARSPVVRMGAHGSPGGLEGLAALAEVAVTEARRRVSGDLPSPAEVRETARRASLSPALSRSPMLSRGPPSLHQPSLSPVLQRSPMLPSPRDTRVNSLAVIPLGAVSSHDGEPPSKRRRRTGSSGAGPVPLAHVPPPPPAPDVPQATSPVTPMLSHPSKLDTESSTYHYATRVASPPHHSPARPVASPPATPQAIHTARPTSISQLLSPVPPARIKSVVDNLSTGQARPPAPDAAIQVGRTEWPVPLDASALSADLRADIKAEGNAEAEESGPVDSRVHLDEFRRRLREPSPAVGREGTPISVQAVFAEEEEIPGPAVAMEEEEDISEPAMVQEEEEPPILPTSVKTEEPPPSLTTQAQEEVVSVPAQLAQIVDVPMLSAAEQLQDVPVSPSPAEAEDVEMQPVPEKVHDVQDVPVRSSSNTSDVPVRRAPALSSLEAADKAGPVSPEVEETIVVPAKPAARADDVSTVPTIVTKDEEDLSSLPGPAAVKHEFGEPSSTSLPAVSHLSGHGGKRQHSDPENRPQDDPHEWLLEHYADSPARDSRRSSPAPEEPPRTPYLSDGSPPPPILKDSPRPSHVSSPSNRVKRPIQKAPSPPRSPTPTALLEQELDGISPEHDDDVAHAPRSPQSDADTDFGLEFDLAATAAPDRDVDPDVSMGNELDDELLSLVDDQPRHSNSHSHPHSHTHSHPHSHHAQSTKVSHAPTAASRHEIPPPANDLVAKKSVATALPPPPPPPTISTSVPPPAQASQPATQQSVSKNDRAGSSAKVEGTTVSASMKKKEPAPKPIAKEKEKMQEKGDETQERPQEVPDKVQEKTKPKPKPRPVAKSKAAKVTGEKDNAAGSSGRLTPSGSAAVTKGKGKKSAAANAAVAAVAAKRGVSTVTGASRSRSASEMPTPAEPPPKLKPLPAPQPEEEEASEEEVVDDKLYCICKTSYDEDKVMIACDRCDEWYHTQCLNIDDLEVDLIDQFVCPPCVMANPNLSLKTTYKARCMAGLKHPCPSSPDACHKPARGAFSKFCSDECGIAYMQRRIEGWGGSQAVLWASVKDTKQREGVVVKVQVLGSPEGASQDEKRPGATVGHLIQEAHEVQQPTKTQRERKIARLQAQLDKLAPKREEVKKDLEVIVWRQKLLQLASARADSLKNECGWDQRLCMDDEDYADFGRAVLESYEEGHAQPNGVDAMHVDGTLEAGEWWCRGVRKCPRHAGWQKLRTSEFEFDRKAKEDAISALTAKEREIRGQLEDAISLPVRKTMVPLQPLNGHQTNGVTAKTNGMSGRKGKQKN